jgi:UDP-N-acetyl-D-glucosamine/UDP-N-acetyl-D-galactosamine dehydrogenase
VTLAPPPALPPIAILGLGYVGLPIAMAFARAAYPVIGFDINPQRIAELQQGHDRTGELNPADLAGISKASHLRFTSNEEALREARFFIITVPTPIDEARRPDLSLVLSACRSVGRALKKGDIVIFESTVYPGATEEECIPLLETMSGLQAGQDFGFGYSPERINPGDQTHRFETIIKVVSGDTQTSLDKIAELYGSVVKAGIHRAPSIKVAEAAKVIENTQRDLNIAFMNELSLIFHRLDIDTSDVLAAARTKWNFLPFTPGLVGGHCIGVDPYYLTHRAEKAGYHPEIILAGRRMNDSVGPRIARECVKHLLAHDQQGPKRIIMLGLTFKENVPDIRNSKAFDILNELKEFGIDCDVCDPLADAEEAAHHGVTLKSLSDLEPADGLILAVGHHAFREGGWALMKTLIKPNAFIMDVKSILDRDTKPEGITLWRL